jgi:small subunit ribosomal protein S16
MLTIRMQRTGRKGHAMFRVVVQDARVTPTSGKVVAQLGSYDPHAKTAVLDKEKAATFLKNGAKPSERAALLLKSEGVKLPKWVELSDKKSGKLRNPEKLRKNQPKEEPKAEEAVAEEPVAETEAKDEA